MQNDKKILETVRKIKKEAKDYTDFVESANPCAYTDRIVENIIKEAETLKSLCDLNT